MADTLTLQALPQPGLAIFPSLLSSTPRSLTMKGGAMGGANFTVIDNATSGTVFTVDSKSFSAHHKKVLLDASGQPLFEIAREKWTLGHRYTAGDVSSGREFFRTETQRGKGLVNGGDTLLTFANCGNGQPVALKFVNHASMSVRANVIDTATGMLVGRIEKQNWKMRHQYQVEVAAGMDPSLLCGLAVVTADIRATKAAVAAAAGAA